MTKINQGGGSSAYNLSKEILNQIMDSPVNYLIKSPFIIVTKLDRFYSDKKCNTETF